MKVRLEKSFNSSLKVADWISNQPKVMNVFHPATKYHPDFKIFRRDFSIGAGLFSFELKEKNLKKIDKFIDNLKFFGIGASWGGFESLILESDLNKITNNGLNVNEIFTNNYYVNDFSQDKRPLPYPPGFCEVDEIKSPIKKSTKIKPPDLNNWGKYDGDAFDAF